jgi:hypothetical protein
MNIIVKYLPAHIHSSLYVDNFFVCYKSSLMNSIKRQLQTYVNKLQIWPDTKGFRFSKSKTICVRFCYKRGHLLDPDLRLDGTLILVVKKQNSLVSSLTLNSHSSFISNIMRIIIIVTIYFILEVHIARLFIYVHYNDEAMITKKVPVKKRVSTRTNGPLVVMSYLVKLLSDKRIAPSLHGKSSTNKVITMKLSSVATQYLSMLYDWNASMRMLSCLYDNVNKNLRRYGLLRNPFDRVLFHDGQ